MREIMVATSKAGHRLIRVNAGQGWVGPFTRSSAGVITIKHPQPFHGVPEGVSDLIGPCVDGVFGALEIKTKTGRATAPQLAYIDQVLRMGGRAGVARSIEEALAILSAPVTRSDHQP